MHKNLSAGMIPKMMSRVEAIDLEKNPHTTNPIMWTTCEDQNKGIMQLCEDEHMQIQKAIRRGNLELRELEEDQVRLK